VKKVKKKSKRKKKTLKIKKKQPASIDPSIHPIGQVINRSAILKKPMTTNG